MFSLIKAAWTVLLHTFRKRVTIQYPEEKQPFPRWRGRIILAILTVSAVLHVISCAAACPVDCIALQMAVDETGRRPFRSQNNFRAAYFAALERLPNLCHSTYTDYEMNEYKRPSMVYEKEDLLISGQGIPGLC
jgi:NADH-quinone oxidoreductase subunit I